MPSQTSPSSAPDSFAPGQRWVSTTEPGLGLGLVVHVAARRVQLLFPAEGATRTYAGMHAPLKRARFAVGDRLQGHDGAELVVEALEDVDGVLIYHGQGVTLPEAALADTLCVEGPEGRLLAGHVDSVAWFELRAATVKHRHAVCRSPVRGLTGARIDLLPHQLYIACEVSGRLLPRVLLADEVGLGKTIEACLILHRLLVCGRASRVLIVVPTALVHQWFVELLRRFSLTFQIFDAQRLEAELEAGAQNPFLEAQWVLCAQELLVTEPAYGAFAVNAGWDLLIVDEAHHLRWSPTATSPDYRLVERLAREIRGVLLLTASPEQSGVAGHFARLRLLDPHRYADLDRFVAEHGRYAEVAAQAEAAEAAGDAERLKDLLDRYGPGRVMFRNSRSTISGFPERIPHRVPLDPSADGPDPRIIWLGRFLKETADEKVLVVCATSDDVLAAAEALRAQSGVDIAAFHEALPLLQCDRQAAWFAEPDGARVLITSGMGGEGRNYQFACHLVLLDIPRSPELVEQRIGRLDRIGQTRDIHIHVPYLLGSVEEARVCWLHEGLDAFSRPLVGGYAMYLQFRDRLDVPDASVIADTRRAHETLCREVEAGRDRLLEWNSCRPAEAAALVTAIRRAEADDTLECYMADVFEQFGVDVEPLGDHDYLLRADRLLCEEFPLPREQDAMRMTYDRSHALSRPSISLLSWDHPMVQGAMDLVAGSERGNAALARASAGTTGVWLRTLYLLEPVASERRAAERFLPPTPVDLVIDETLEVVAPPQTAGDGEPWWLTDEVRVERDTVGHMLTAAREAAGARAETLRARAEVEMQETLGAELLRLQRLQKVNDHIRPEELEALDAQRCSLLDAIRSARLRLDAVCLIVGE